jgi:two-component system nitrogen regulation sensor histidine kinase NtrY
MADRPEQYPEDIPYQENKHRKTQFLRRWGHVVRWSRKVNLPKKLENTLAILALISGTATIIAVSRKSAPFNMQSDTIQYLMLANVIFMLALFGVIGRWVVNLWVSRKQGQAGLKLHRKIVGFFSLIAVVPPIIMAIFTALFFQFGIDAWFSENVRNTLNNSLEVAEAYIIEHRRVINADLFAMANDLNHEAARVQQNSDFLQSLVDEQLFRRSLSEAFVFNSNGQILARASLNISLAPARVPEYVMSQITQGEAVILSNTDDDRVRALVKLEQYFDAYLYVSHVIDPKVLAYVQSARDSVSEYQSIAGERSVIQLQFYMIYLIVSFLIILVAIWVGLNLATALTKPIIKLINASEKIGKGELKVRVPAGDTSDELGTLSRAFNQMTAQLDEQQMALKASNEQLNERHRFTEAVLYGVSAGVIGIDKGGKITLPNRAACELLFEDIKDLIGKDIHKVIPEVIDLLNEVKKSNTFAQGQISLMRNDIVRTLLVAVSPQMQDDTSTGYVITFDDITEQLAHQRTAAWADVARRIAHEIKNPLTPIQLSAERIKRKYAKEIKTDPQVFDQCTNTIIKQVGDLKNIVDEFSSFAKMPAPKLKREDIKDIVRQAVFLQQVGRPTLVFDVRVGKEIGRLVCDSRLISQALTNLLKNAGESIIERQNENKSGKKFEGHIDIDITSFDQILKIIISDNGNGIPKELAERIFDPYVTTRQKGTGLGLAIVRKIMEDHGGSLTIKNKEKEKGAVATLTFSLRATKEETPDAAE